jgi:hypothetical protein
MWSVHIMERLGRWRGQRLDVTVQNTSLHSRDIVGATPLEIAVVGSPGVFARASRADCDAGRGSRGDLAHLCAQPRCYNSMPGNVDAGQSLVSKASKADNVRLNRNAVCILNILNDAMGMNDQQRWCKTYLAINDSRWAIIARIWCHK